MTDESLIGILHITLTNFPQPQGKECISILEASDYSAEQNSNLTPEFRFSQVEESRFQHQDRRVKVSMKSTTCYIVIAGKYRKKQLRNYISTDGKKKSIIYNIIQNKKK